MKSPRRIGTFTAGFTLILLGAALLLYTFFPNYQALEFALRLWPLVLILLGIELLRARFTKNDPPVSCDFGAIVVMLLCIGFAFCCEFARYTFLYYLTGSPF